MPYLLVAVPTPPHQILQAEPGREGLLHAQNVESLCEDIIGIGMC